MTQTTYNLVELIADEGKVFDWADLSAHTIEQIDPETNETIIIQDHLYAKKIFLGVEDSANNYVEVAAPQEV